MPNVTERKTKDRLLGAYRSWQRLNHNGLNDDSVVGIAAFQRAKAIWLLVAMAPFLPLMISDAAGVARGLLWYGWSIIAIGWAVGITGLMIVNVARSMREYMRNWREKRKS